MHGCVGYLTPNNTLLSLTHLLLNLVIALNTNIVDAHIIKFSSEHFLRTNHLLVRWQMRLLYLKRNTILLPTHLVWSNHMTPSLSWHTAPLMIRFTQIYACYGGLSLRLVLRLWWILYHTVFAKFFFLFHRLSCLLVIVDHKSAVVCIQHNIGSTWVHLHHFLVSVGFQEQILDRGCRCVDLILLLMLLRNVGG